MRWSDESRHQMLWILGQPWSKYLWLMVAIATLAFAYVLTSDRRKHAEQAKRRAIARCTMDGESRSACKQRVEDHHEDCFRWAHEPGGPRGAPATTDLTAYKECIVMGAPAYEKMRRP